MAITNAVLAQKISDLITQWQTMQLEQQAWMSGAVGGGPGLDGRYPLTDYLGITVYATAPAQLEDDVSNLVTGAAGYSATASAASVAAALSETNAAASAASAASQVAQAQTAQSLAEDAQAAAESARNTAIAQAALAVTSASNAATSESNALASELAAAASESAAAASAAAAATFDPALYAALADNEAITGVWDFKQSTATPVFNIWGSTTGDPAASASQDAQFNFTNASGVEVGDIGWTVGPTLRVRNLVHGGNVLLSGQDLAGLDRNMLVADPDGEVAIYHAGTYAFRSVAAASGGLQANNTATGAGLERVLTTSDGALYAAKASAAAISGAWTFSAAPAMTAGMTMGTSLGDRLALYGAFSSASMYGFGIEAGTLYSKGYGYRWYIGANADGGVSDKMELGVNGLSLMDGDYSLYNGTALMVRIRADLLSEGMLQLRNGANYGLIAKGVGNNPEVGTHTGGTLRFTAFNSQDGAVDTLKGSSGHVAEIDFTTEVLNVYGAVTATGAVTGSNLNVANWDTAYGWGNHAGLYEPINAALTALNANEVITAAWDFDATIGGTYGINGRYSSAGGSSTYGATIWSLDSTWQGSAAGADSGNSNVYGVRWLRGGHVGAISSVGEGLYLYVAGALKSCMGQVGFYTEGNIQLGHATDTTISRLSAGQIGVEGRGVFQHAGSQVSAQVTYSTSAPSGGSNGDLWFQYT